MSQGVECYSCLPKTRLASDLSDRQRSPGSNGSTTTPGRVYKGVRRPGHMGDEQVTSQNLKVLLVDPERNIIGLNGAVPGAKGSLVVIKETRKQ